MAFTQADLDQLDAAIASGVMQVTDKDGRSTRYDSFEDMMRRRAFILGQLGGANGGQTILLSSRTGLSGNASGLNDCTNP